MAFDEFNRVYVCDNCDMILTTALAKRFQPLNNHDAHYCSKKCRKEGEEE